MKKISAIFLALLLVITCCCTGFTVSAATASPTWKANSVTSLTQTDAKISVKVTFSSKKTFTEGGFYIGTSKTNMHKNAYPDKNFKITSSYLTSSFLMSKYKEKLKAGTTYYYQTYCVANGKTYKSPVYSFTTKKASTTPTWKINTPSNITFNDATIGGTVTFPSNVKVTKCGFYLSTSKTNLGSANSKTISKTTTSLTSTFKLSSYKKTLKYNTTYYYKFFVVAGGKTYTSSVNSFKTASADNYVTPSVSGITKTNAVVTAKISNPAKYKLASCLLQIGTSSSSLKTVKTYNPNSKATSQSYTFNLNSCGQKLTANTTYYYRLGLKIGNTTFYTSTKSFKTESTATKIYFPLPTSQKWVCSTYNGHGGENASAYCSVDMKIKNKGCAGYAVYAMADGVVINDTYKSSNGQITIKFTTPMITTNGKKYTTWYGTYAHMTDITVKKGTKVTAGQQIGKVGNVGKSYGAHLHLSIGSGNGGTGWYQKTNKKKAISPYYIYGFVNSDGSTLGYCGFESSTPMTNLILNNAPTGS